MKVFIMLVLPALALGAATRFTLSTLAVLGLPLTSSTALARLPRSIPSERPTGKPSALRVCYEKQYLLIGCSITNFVTGIIGCVPGLSSLSDIPGFPSLPAGDGTASQPTGTAATPAIPGLV
ncbi:hypothetical protein FBULB1_11510 [Fusarium bulbicola]|nr:hypothetical protein FBULB1_11510 [Fusarium bulbicola]